MKQLDLDPLIKPESLALVGASSDEKKIGGRFMKSFLRNGFTGKLYPVNLKAPEVMGVKAYPSLQEIPGEIDVVILVIPAAATESAVEACVRKGVKFAIVHGAGFSEIGAMGKQLETRVIDIARKGGVRIVGPNCMGLFCPQVNLNSIVARYDVPLDTGSAGFWGQSGWVCENTVLLASTRGMGFSGVVSSGNQADLDTPDYLEYFQNDPQTRVLGAYLEGIRDGRRFLAKAKHVSRSKPVVIWKSGKTEAGARAVASHTGSMAGFHQVTDAALKQAGVTCAGDLEELLDYLIAFCCPHLPKGRRVCMLVESGGGGAAAADTCEPIGLEVPPLSREVQQEFVDFITGKIPPTSGLSNPVDIVWAPAHGARDFWFGCMEILLKTADSLMVITYYNLGDDEFIKGVAHLRDRTKKPIVIIPGHSTSYIEGMAKCVKTGIPVYLTPERAAKSLRAMVRYSEYLQG
jgi:acetyltransferase